jgi:hypothetical protein
MDSSDCPVKGEDIRSRKDDDQWNRLRISGAKKLRAFMLIPICFSRRLMGMRTRLFNKQKPFAAFALLFLVACNGPLPPTKLMASGEDLLQKNEDPCAVSSCAQVAVVSSGSKT